MTPAALEAVVLGTMLRHGHHPNEIWSRLEIEDFRSDRNRKIYAAISALLAEGKAVDAFEVEASLSGVFENPIGEVAALIQAAGAIENLSFRIAELRKSRRSHALRNILLSAIDELEENPAQADTLRARLIADLSSSEGTEGRSDVKSLQQAIHGAVDALEENFTAKTEGRSLGVTTGMPMLDSVIGGLRKSNMVVVGARPSMGKTAWMVTAALAAARSGASVGIISTEMSAEQIGQRFASQLAGVNHDVFVDGNPTEQDFEAIAYGMSQVAGLNITICDNPVMTVPQILALCKSWQLLGGLDALFVDYLGNLRGSGKYENRTLEVGQISNGLKTIARQMNIPVVVMAQLNRGLESRPDKRPNMGDLRDSGMIEQDADQIIFLYRPWVYDKTRHPSEAEMLIGKNRHGAIAIIESVFHGATMTWTAPLRDTGHAW